jgi:hypothetical protein
MLASPWARQECDCWRCKHEAVRAAAMGEGGGDDDDAAMQSASESEEGDEGSAQQEESEWETDEEDDGVEGQLAVFLLKHLCPNEQCSGAPACLVCTPCCLTTTCAAPFDAVKGTTPRRALSASDGSGRRRGGGAPQALWARPIPPLSTWSATFAAPRAQTRSSSRCWRTCRVVSAQ